MHMVTPELLSDRSRTFGGCVSLVFGTIFAGVGLLFVVIGLAVTGASAIGVFPAAFGALFTLVGGFLAITGLRALWLSRLLGTSTLMIPGRQPLYLGGGAVAQYRRTGGARRARNAPQLSAMLVCDEQATYRKGTDDHTVTEEIYRRELAITNDYVPDTVSGQVTIRIPADVPPSIMLGHNRIVWTVQVTVRVAGVPDDTGTFAFTVLPALAGTVGTVGGGASDGHEPGAPR
jgi:hypothetical protein